MKVEEAFQVLGLNRLEATVLTYLITKKRAYFIEIERETGLRQPEVSAAIRGLKKFDVVGLMDERRHGIKRGRPKKIAFLRDVKKLMNFLRERKEKVDKAYEIVETFVVANTMR